MTREQGEALIEYITAALDDRMAAHTLGHPPPQDSTIPPPSAVTREQVALSAFRALLP